MKKIYVKYKILVNGLSTEGEFKKDGFTLKTGKLKKDFLLKEGKKYNEKIEGLYLNMNLYLISCLTNYKKLTYRYFESDQLVEYEVSNKINKENINTVLEKYPEIIKKVNDFEKKLRLVLNIPILFQTITIEFYDENKNFISASQCIKPISSWNRLKYNIDPKEFHNNSRFNMNFSYTEHTNNMHFERALEFYNNSFESEHISVRYILIFSALEAIFNLDGETI